MSLTSGKKPKWLAAALAFALGAFVQASAWAAPASSPSVETYVDQAVPSPPPPGMLYDSPLTAGELTLEDVLAIHPKKKEQPAAQPVPQTTTAKTAPPLLSSSSGASAASVMLMQGMKTILQQADTGTAPTLKPPQLPNGSATPSLQSTAMAPQAPAQPAASSTSASPPTFQYEPGEEPKNLAAEPGSAPQTPAPAPQMPAVPKATEMAKAPVPLEQMPQNQAAAAPAESASIFGAPVNETAESNVSPGPALQPQNTSAANATPAACEPHVESWTKTCSDAGYPASFTGKIIGETRTVCPSGELQDVWVSNTCGPPEEEAAAPSAPASEETNGNASEVSPAALASAAPAAESAPAPPASPMPVPSPITSVTPERMDAACGPANGLAALGKPITDLCASGASTDVLGEGPWRWSCKGLNGGMTVSCAAPIAAKPSASTPALAGVAPTPSVARPAFEDGTCGAANGAGIEQAPTTGLCAKGIASRVNGDGPWTWACSGLNGGQAVACQAPKKADGVCGAANGKGSDEMPMTDLCTSGFASAVTGEGPWNWTCSGTYGGQAAMCSAAPKKDAVCGAASMNGHHETPNSDLCSVGKVSDVNGGGPWSWTCQGINDGASVSCTAPVAVDGACGPVNGTTLANAPEENLCAAGRPSRVTGAGPWNWNCTGTDGGNTESCTAAKAPEEAAPVVSAAPVANEELASVTSGGNVPSETSAAGETSAANCGAASEAAALHAPGKDLCRNGTAGEVSGDGPWVWTCTDGNGHKTSCSTLAPSNGQCGSASSVPSMQPPTANLCTAGIPAEVTYDKNNWLWTCEGALGGSSVSCEAPISKGAQAAAPSASIEMLACGTAAGQGVSREPSDNLCVNGKASLVRGKGPWRWTCTKDKHKVSCEAPKMVDAACGLANGSVQKLAPVHGLCTSGTPTEIQGNGPWLWSCVGAGGGASVSCSAMSQAQTRVDGACGAASNTPVTGKPITNLCDSGVASTVYGEGPWTWTCSGLNGGIASSCSVQKVVPQAPPPPGPSVNGLCGSANGLAAIVQPMDNLCSTGTVTAVSGNGPWNWNCLGQNGGMTVSCTAPLMPPAPITGECGEASGMPTLTMPRSGLCSAGISSAVSGRGPWTWSCSGTNGGGAVACVAPLAAGGGTGALPSLVTPSSEAPAPKSAVAAPVQSSSLVTPQLPSGPLPPLTSGSMPAYQPSKAFEAPPQASAVPPEPEALTQPPPSAAPELPADATPVIPPPVRDTIRPSPALMPPAIDNEGQPVPGNHFELDPDLSTIGFPHGSDNVDHDMLAKLDQLALVLKANSGVRITLTAYSGLDSNISPRDARRLSLSRALAIRDYLTSRGISSARIDVRALGANVPSGDPDRVDVKAN